MRVLGNSQVVQWLGLHVLTAKGLGSIPGRGTKIPQAARCGQKKTKTVRVLKRQVVLLLLVSWAWALYNLPSQLSFFFRGEGDRFLKEGVKSLTVRAEILRNNQSLKGK